MVCQRVITVIVQGQGEFGVYSAAPVPGYVERKRDVINVDMKEDCPARDICYHLLQLYCKRYLRFLCNKYKLPSTFGIASLRLRGNSVGILNFIYELVQHRFFETDLTLYP